MPSKSEWISGVSSKGFRLPIDRVNRVRKHAGLPPLPDPKPVQQKLRGLGDVVAVVAKAIGLARTVDAVSKATGIPCGCEQRRKKLNKLVPFSDAE